MLFHKTSKNSKISFKMNGFLIEQSDSIKYLGVVLDDKLNWKKHLSSLKSKLSRSFFCQNWDIIWTQLHLKWCIIDCFICTSNIVISAWGGAADYYLKPIVCMKKRVIRYAGNVPPLTTTNPLFKKTNVLKLNDVLNS